MSLVSCCFVLVVFVCWLVLACCLLFVCCLVVCRELSIDWLLDVFACCCWCPLLVRCCSFFVVYGFCLWLDCCLSLLFVLFRYFCRLLFFVWRVLCWCSLLCCLLLCVVCSL